MARFRVKPHSEPRRPQSPAQKAATERAFRIFRLRGLWCQTYLLTGERRTLAQQVIDAELALLGAEPHATRMAAEADDVARRLPPPTEAEFAEVEQEIPF